MRIFSSVVYPTVCFLPVSISYDHHRCAVATQFVRYYHFLGWPLRLIDFKYGFECLRLLT